MRSRLLELMKYLALSVSTLGLSFSSSSCSLLGSFSNWLQMICSSGSAKMSGTLRRKLSASPRKM